jgi:hypothetical protein
MQFYHMIYIFLTCREKINGADMNIRLPRSNTEVTDPYFFKIFPRQPLAVGLTPIPSSVKFAKIVRSNMTHSMYIHKHRNNYIGVLRDPLYAGLRLAQFLYIVVYMLPRWCETN